MLICVCVWRLLESWIDHSNFKIMTKSGKLEQDGKAEPYREQRYVIRCSDVGSKLGKCTFEEAFGNTLDVDLGFTVEMEEPLVIEALSDYVPPPKSSRVSGSDIEILEFDLQSLLVPQEAIDKYKMSHARLKKELKLILLEDHIWTLKSFDNNNIGIVKL